MSEKSVFPAGTDGESVLSNVKAMAIAGQGMTEAGHVIYAQHNTPKLAKVFLDGEVVGAVIAACQEEGWVIATRKDPTGKLVTFKRDGKVQVRLDG